LLKETAHQIIHLTKMMILVPLDVGFR